MIFFTFGLFFFDKGSNQFLPLLFIVISFVSFEIVNLFYNLSLSKIRKKILQEHYQTWVGHLGI